MAPIPAFEIGLWNAWIFMLAFGFFHIAPTLLVTRTSKGELLKKRFAEAPPKVPYNETERKMNVSWIVILCLLFIYSVFLPLSSGTAWFYTGLAIFVLGVIVYQIAAVPWAFTPVDEPFTKGLYRYSRHPMYVGAFLQLIGVGIVSASWVFLLFSIVLIVLVRFQVIPEERFCYDKYGDAYREYMNRTPRWIGILKSG